MSTVDTYKIGSEDDDGTAEVRAIRGALKQAEHNKSEAARLLGISRRTLYRKLEQHNIVF